MSPAKTKRGTTASSKTPPELVAVIDIGSSAIRLLIAEISGVGKWREIDRASKPLALGRDVFVSGTISRESIQQCLQILAGFGEMMATYGVERVRAIATSALREANNKETFLDRIKVRTGIEIEIIEGVEANQLTYMAVRRALKGRGPRLGKSNTMIIEVGGGSTEVVLLDGGKIITAHTLHIGTIRMQPAIQQGSSYRGYAESFLRQNMHGILEVIAEDYNRPVGDISQFIAVGGDARYAASVIPDAVDVGPHCKAIPMKAFEKFIHRLDRLTLDEIVKLYHIPYRDAETLHPALLVYLLFAEVTGATRILVPDSSIRDGVLVEMSSDGSEVVEEEFRRQVIASVWGLARKYHADVDHAQHVTDLAMVMFDFLTGEHALGLRQRLLLELASILHDIGSFVNPNAHHKHAQYIIANSEVFGLNRDDLAIVSNVVRYHRKSPPMPSHMEFASLTLEDRLVVMKLAAILRLADALDRGHERRIWPINLKLTEDSLVIACPSAGDLSLERLSLDSKGDMFEDVFGLKVRLVSSIASSAHTSEIDDD